jgi:hypothetical protein
MTTTPDLHTRVRIFIYQYIGTEGAAPLAERIATDLSVSVDAARDALEELARTRQVILDPTTREIWMAGPFSAVKTRFEVRDSGSDPAVTWWANCAWDMLGIPAALGRRVHIVTTCADCGDRVGVDVDPIAGPTEDRGVVHILLPAREWYRDIGFT